MASMPKEQNPNFKHGFCVGGKKIHPLYAMWNNMKARCLNYWHEKYHRYGGRGIKICDDWLISANFINWAIEAGWQEGLSLDRIDNDGNYEPSNCQFVSKGKNSRKKSTTKLTIDQAKEIRNRSEKENWNALAKEFKVSHGTIWFIVNEMTWDENLT